VAACNASDPDTYYYENERFHTLIYKGSHNTFLAEQASALHRRLRPYRRLQLRVRDRVPASLHEHEGIIEAIVAGDADLTAQRLREHITVQGQRFGDLMASLAGLQREAAEMEVEARKRPPRARRSGEGARRPH